jgi:hypothetical protein
MAQAGRSEPSGLSEQPQILNCASNQSILPRSAKPVVYVRVIIVS